MVVEIIPKQATDVFPMNEIAISLVKSFLNSDIFLPPVETDEDLSRLLANGIRIVYDNEDFILSLLTFYNRNKYDYSVAYGE